MYKPMPSTPLPPLHEAALTLLRADARQNALLTERLVHGLAEDVGVYGNSVRLKDARSGNYMFSAESMPAFERLYEEAKTRPQIFFLADDALAEELKALGFLPVVMHQWLMEQDAGIPPAEPQFSFAPAKLSDLDLIESAYQSEEFGRAYLADVIRDNLSVCAYDGDRLAGFMLTHKDGETGPMVVFGQYHKHGLGDQLIRRISNMMRAEGILPIGHIYPENTVSAYLHERVGYRPCEKSVLWVYPGV